jgi:hypothetical protein
MEPCTLLTHLRHVLFKKEQVYPVLKALNGDQKNDSQDDYHRAVLAETKEAHLKAEPD